MKVRIRKRKQVAPRSYLEDQFERVIKFYKLPEPTREFVFHRYRFDFAWESLKIAVEIDGGTFSHGAHVRGVGYARDCRKNNLAQLEGWVVLRADRNMVHCEEFAKAVKMMIVNRINWKKTGRLPY